MKFTSYGHSCFAVDFESTNKTLVFDPYITPNPLAAGVDFDQIRADAILISHGHDDHTFPWITIDHAAARQTFADEGITLHLPVIGSSLAL